MSSLITVDFSQVPSFAKSQSAVAASLSASLAGGVKRLSIKGGVFRYVVGGQEIGKIKDRFLDIVLVNAAPHVSRTLYSAAWDPNAKPTPPICWSPDGIKPDAQVKEPQSPNCASCPKNVKGSGTNNSRACRYSQRLAVVLANDIGGEVLQLSVPATSIFGDGNKEVGASLQGYIKGLSSRSIDPAALTTRVAFDTDKESPTILFSAVGWLDQTQYDTAVEQGKTESAVKAITMTVFESEGVDADGGVPLPSGAPPVMRAIKAAPKVEPSVPPPEVQEPVVRRGVEAATAARADLAALMDEFATDD